MLKGIHPLLTADVLTVLAQMGHGDVLAVVDRNYPAYAAARPVVSVPGADTTQFARALFSVFPVDTFITNPIARMRPVDGPDRVLDVQHKFLNEAQEAEGRLFTMESVDRFDFYERSRTAFAVIATTDDRAYGCFFVTKGVVSD